jgi:hypothetical protein
MVFSSQLPFLGWFGFNLIYDAAAPLVGIVLDTIRVPFQYNDMDWMMQIWKGSYFGGFHGAEFGFYQRQVTGRFLNHYQPALDTILPMQLWVYHGDELLFSTEEWPRWWLAAMQYSNEVLCYNELRMEATIEFASETMLRAFLPAFEAHSPEGVSWSVDGLNFWFEW